MNAGSPVLASSVPRRAISYRPAIDGLRALAVLSVFIFHLNRAWLPGGFVGVDVFFVISGYLITSILIREYENKSFSLWKFYQRRIARLFPAFFTVALATLLAAQFIYLRQDIASAGANLVAAALSVTNLKYLAQGSYFAVSPDAQPYLHYWSLSVEEQFYMLFPATLAIVYSRFKMHISLVLGVLCCVSLLACILLTPVRPDWAFYLLPTRAWELLAGSILASLAARRVNSPEQSRPVLSLAGLSLIIVSLFALHEGPEFPGFRAILPVAGTALVIGTAGYPGSWAERLLSAGPLVLIGRMSYSLYLWHWPVFSLVDYKFYLSSLMVRVALKVGLSLAGATLCFFLVESPGRAFLNRPQRRRLAFAFLIGAVAVCVPLGTVVRNANYIDAVGKDITRGGIAWSPSGAEGSLVLMGDSNASMYGTTVMDIARELRLKTNVISVHAGDPLPRSSGPGPQLWFDSLTFLKREPPDFLLLACNWEAKLKADRGRLGIAVDELKRHTRWLILLTQPPQMPDGADRASIRNGSRPPFVEDRAERAARLEAKALVRSFQSDRVIVIDVDPFFTGDRGIRFASPDGRMFYYDYDHLSDVGADLVRADILNALKLRLRPGPGRR